MSENVPLLRDLDFLGPGPPSTRGWDRSPDLFYRCSRCGSVMPADFNDYFTCTCGAMSLDIDAGRFGSHFGDKSIEVYRRRK